MAVAATLAEVAAVLVVAIPAAAGVAKNDHIILYQKSLHQL
jgi:hypothetical protein